MRTFQRVLSGIAGFGIIAAAAFPASAIALRVPNASKVAPRLNVASVPRSMVPTRDFGRRSASALITATVLLRYNHEAELDALVDAQGDPASPLHGHFLTSAQFNNYFAPTPQQHAYVIAALRAAGLSVVGVFPNRTVIDVQGPTGAAERFFGTEIHSVLQGSYGQRFANVRPASVSADLAPLVRSVSLSNLVVARTRPQRPYPLGLPSDLALARPVPAEGAQRSATAPGRFVIGPPATTGAPGRRRLTTTHAANIIADPGFESGGFGDGWQQCESSTVSPGPQITTAVTDGGKYSGFAGPSGTSEQVGYAGVCQLVTIPSSGILSADVHQLSNETDASYAAQDTFLINTGGYIASILAQTANNKPGFQTLTWNLKNFVGQKVYVYFGVHGDGAKSFATKQYVDNVSLVTGTAGASVPTPVANISTTCKGSLENGPLTQTNDDGETGHLATSIAKAFDFPVQHGCNGAGETAAIVIDGQILQSDVNLYMKASGVTQTGKLVNIPIDGGSKTVSGEGSLDAETVIGLAPAATTNVYVIPSLTDQDIIDAYDRAVSDNTAVAVNSSFGGCEADDPSGDMSNDAVYVQGAALGITFVGTTGDTGSNECNDGPNGAASEGVASGNSPHAVAVGSVNFTESSSGMLESISSASDPSFGFESGGGVSTVYPLPRYQTGIANVLASGRNQPDLSLPGDRTTVYTNGKSETNDGTSWSGPEFTALLTTSAEVRNKRGFGFANPAIYSLFRSSGYTDFIDSTSGNNTGYTAKAGYDQVTGIGVPKGYTFASAL
jgi:subtilase family serine protease